MGGERAKAGLQVEQNRLKGSSSYCLQTTREGGWRQLQGKGQARITGCIKGNSG